MSFPALMPKTVNVTIRQGMKNELLFTNVDGDGNPFNATGLGARLYVINKLGNSKDADPILDSASKGTLTGIVGGWQYTLLPGDADGLPIGTYNYNLYCQADGSHNQLAAVGTLTVRSQWDSTL